MIRSRNDVPSRYSRSSRLGSRARRSGTLASYFVLGTLALAATTNAAQQPARALQPVKNIPPAGSKAQKYGYTIVRTYPHDPNAYTQGLAFRDGFLYEGTGLKGKSSLRRVELESGKVVQEVGLHPQYFGEGITLMSGRLFQLTWQDRTGFVYDTKTFKLLRNFSYFGEGWGLGHDNTNLILSDGTSTLRFLEPTRFQERRRLKVTDSTAPIANLNELEWVRGEIWANVWGTEYIARISPKDGRILGWVNLSGLLPATTRLSGEAVLNGIAYEAQSDRLFVTGKLWPRLFEIKVK
jgi:glutaminyl-peptide cyclotransferase